MKGLQTENLALQHLYNTHQTSLLFFFLVREEKILQLKFLLGVLLLLVAIGVYGVTEDKQVRLVLVTE